ncbi:MAG: hypothetical protein WBR18_15695 [Anaerolineales bacterium]
MREIVVDLRRRFNLTPFPARSSGPRLNGRLTLPYLEAILDPFTFRLIIVLSIAESFRVNEIISTS